MGDKGKMALQVLDEIKSLIQDRIGGGLAPDGVKIEAQVGELAPDAAAGEPDADDLGIGDDDASALAGLWEAEGLGSEDAPPHMDMGGDEEEKKKKLMTGA